MGTTLSDLLAGLATINGDEERRSLRQVASLVHLSSDRAQRVFTRLVGESPSRYQHRVGLDRAAAQLLVSDRPIADIAFDNGFGSHEGFTRAFNDRYGTSPRDYRKAATTAWSPEERTIAETTTPCIGLYKKPTAGKPSINDQERAMEDPQDQAVTVEELSATPVLYMTRRIDREAFASVLAELLPAVFQYVMAHGLAMAGPPYVRYLEQSAAFLSVQAGIPLAEVPKPPATETNIEVGELPAGSTASTIHRGPYETLGESHVVLDRWIAANRYEAAGPPWEVYLTDPGEVPDPKDWETQILWPIASIG